MVVNFQVVVRGRYKFGYRSPEAGLVDDLTDSAAEALGHTVGLGMARQNTAMLDPELFAQDVKYMLAAGCSFAFVIFFLAGKMVGKLTTTPRLVIKNASC